MYFSFPKLLSVAHAFLFFPCSDEMIANMVPYVVCGRLIPLLFSSALTKAPSCTPPANQPFIDAFLWDQVIPHQRYDLFSLRRRVLFFQPVPLKARSQM